MKRILSLILILFWALLPFNSEAQIYAPEGLNMPGEWDSWTNPPSNTAFAGIQNSGNLLPTSGLGTNNYQTIFSTPTDVAAGSYAFLFSSGPTSNYWQNKWTDGTFTTNSITVLTLNGSNDNTITLADNKFYVMNWEDIGYEDTRAVFMELDAAPVSITSVSQNPTAPQADEVVTVTVTADNTPSENVYLRYSTTGWTSAQLVDVVFSGSTGTAQIPGQSQGTDVEYYVFTTAMDNPSSDFDLITIDFDNNSGSNYSYSIAEELNCEDAAGVLTGDPVFPIHNGSITLTFDASLGNGVLMGYEGDVYAHTGVITSESQGNNDWQYVVSEWGVNEPEFLFTEIEPDLYQLTIDNIREFYGVPTGEEIYKIAMVIRSDEPIDPEEPDNFYVARNADGSDLFVEVYNEGLNVKYLGPLDKDPLVPTNTQTAVCIYALDANEISLKIDDIEVASTADLHLMYALNTGDYAPGTHEIVAIASDGTDFAYDTTSFYIRGDVTVQELPAGMEYGINYIDDNTVTLVFHEPSLDKEFMFVIGDFNNWTATDEGYMKRTPDGTKYWTTISGLTPGEEYAYQYYVDGELKLADPYCDKILDPWNDRYIPETTYPNLKDYPWDKTLGIVSVLETGQIPYDWVIDDFTPSAVGATQSNLVIYELLIRDFIESRDIKDVEAKLDYLQSLGVNAIELMPISEFDGNDSWGYAPNFFYAPDKAYGTKDDYKAFIDACHERGIAVIMDVVYNHQFGGSPFVQLYWDDENNQPAANNAWFNTQATHPYSVGYDFNHESTHTRELVKDNLEYWMTEYKIDGFRFDLSKGFTQFNSGGDVGLWSQYDQSRIDIIMDYYNHIKSVNSNAYVILEHLANNDEEVVLANNGCLMWGVMTSQFAQAAMGWDSNHDFSWAYYGERGYTYPNLIPYMESHDEERLMYEVLEYGNGTVGDVLASLHKAEAAAVMYMTIPGPKMIWQFGEYGYDESIFLCWDGSYSDECRTASKPIHWDYLEDFHRQYTYRIYSSLIKLKTENAAFREGSFSQDQSGLGKRMWISHPDMNVVVAANFAAFGFDMAPGFQHAGTWYNYFTGESIDVSDPGGHTIYFNSGDYYVFTDVPLDKPFLMLTVNVQSTGGQTISGAQVSITAFPTIETDANGNAFFLPESNTTVDYEVTATGYETATGSISLGTADHTETVVLNPLGTEDIKEESFRIYPNPTSKGFTAEFNEEGKLQILDLSGRILMQQNIPAGSQYVDTGNLRAGVYFLQFNTENRSLVKKLIIR